MYLTVKQNLKHLTKKEYETIYSLAHICKSLYNVALYNVNINYDINGQHLTYESNYHQCKDNINYKLLHTDFGQAIIKRVDNNFKAFFSLIKLAKKGKYLFEDIDKPHYLPKKNITTIITIAPKRCIKNGRFYIPLSTEFKKLNNLTKNDRISIKLPPILLRNDITIKQIMIIPKNNGRTFECQYVVESKDIQTGLDKTKALSIDLGVNNLCTCIDTDGKSFIIDGKRLKSINKHYNKRISKLQSINIHQRGEKAKYTNLMNRIGIKRKNQLNYYIHKCCSIIINHCLENNIGNLVVGYKDDFQQNCNMGKKNNQTFVYIPFGQLTNTLKYLCDRYNINFVMTEESYTSLSSFFDNDDIPTYNADNPHKYTFSGKRVKRGLYNTIIGYKFNADVNGALNILRKSILKSKLTNVDFQHLQCIGCVNEPLRIRIW